MSPWYILLYLYDTFLTVGCDSIFSVGVVPLSRFETSWLHQSADQPDYFSLLQSEEALGVIPSTLHQTEEHDLTTQTEYEFQLPPRTLFTDVFYHRISSYNIVYPHPHTRIITVRYSGYLLLFILDVWGFLSILPYSRGIICPFMFVYRYIILFSLVLCVCQS